MARPLYMDAVITPNRSLPIRGFLVLIGVIVLANLLVAAFLIAIGAFPVPLFLGLDVLGVLIAFRASYRSGRLAERVRVSAEEVSVAYEGAGRSRTVWRSPTAFTAVAIERPGEHETRVRLRLSNQRLTVARALSPKERSAFADALERAILSARAERSTGAISS
ncbi:MAG TPA: DUF2244 domain-containing protein [Caulobacteraceae bacterium]|nr:DUF2244 domain-containing protein [Caulobacteraceae bacterium]